MAVTPCFGLMSEPIVAATPRTPILALKSQWTAQKQIGLCIIETACRAEAKIGSDASRRTEMALGRLHPHDTRGLAIGLHVIYLVCIQTK